MTAVLIVAAWVAASILLGIAWVLLAAFARSALDADRAYRAFRDHHRHQAIRQEDPTP